jgi:hypothetical protein
MGRDVARIPTSSSVVQRPGFGRVRRLGAPHGGRAQAPRRSRRPAPAAPYAMHASGLIALASVVPDHIPAMPSSPSDWNLALGISLEFELWHLGFTTMLGKTVDRQGNSDFPTGHRQNMKGKTMDCSGNSGFTIETIASLTPDTQPASPQLGAKVFGIVLSLRQPSPCPKLFNFVRNRLNSSYTNPLVFGSYLVNCPATCLNE